MGGDFEEREERLRELQEQFPGWRIYARRLDNLTDREQWWAEPGPRITAASAGELAEQIRAAHSQPRGSLVLASWRSYTARARRLREYEIAAVADWGRRKAEQAARMTAAMADPVTSFYLRHGWRAAAAAEAAAPCAPTGTGGEEPDTA